MTWAEISDDESLWSLSKSRTKADRAHDVPLSELARSVIEGSPRMSAYVFATGRRGVSGAESVAPSGWGKAKERLDKLANERAAADGAHDRLAPWRVHDLRRTCATNLARLGVPRLVISKVLNHAEQGVTKRYDRHEYFREKREALDRWAAHLTGIVNGHTSNVVQLLEISREGK